MRIKIVFNSDNIIQIPVNYNYLIQSLIYNLISPYLSDFLHNTGYTHGKRSFKLFTFSRIFGKYDYNETSNLLSFQPPISIVISSILKDFIQQIADEVLRNENLKISKNRVSAESVEIFNPKLNDQQYKIKMLSPITMYSTLSKANGQKKTYYYSPHESEFSELISENAKKKYESFFNRKIAGHVSLNAQNLSNSNLKTINYKGTIINGWMGIYELSGDKELIHMIYHAGIGGKNSQGFGCFELL